MAVIGFDWDGTILDSIPAKTRAFPRAINQAYKTSIDEQALVGSYVRNKGQPRFEQLRIAQQEFRLPTLDAEGRERWSDAYTRLYEAEGLRLFDDARPTLQELRRRGHRLFISSGVPQETLQRQVAQQGLEGLFRDEQRGYVFGSDTQDYPTDAGPLDAMRKIHIPWRKGEPHFYYVSHKLGVPAREILYVGDTAEDVRVANSAGCVSIAKRDTSKPDAYEYERPRKLISTLADLLTMKELS